MGAVFTREKDTGVHGRAHLLHADEEISNFHRARQCRRRRHAVLFHFKPAVLFLFKHALPALSIAARRSVKIVQVRCACHAGEAALPLATSRIPQTKLGWWQRWQLRSWPRAQCYGGRLFPLTTHARLWRAMGRIEDGALDLHAGLARHVAAEASTSRSGTQAEGGMCYSAVAS